MRKKTEFPHMNELAKVIEKVKPDDLREIVRHWCEKNYQHHKQFAASVGLPAMDVLHAALLYTEHPLIVGERGWLYGLIHQRAEIIMAQLEERDLPIPISVIPSTAPVERMA